MISFFVAALIIADQLTKWLTIRFLKPVGSVELIPHILSLTYVENRGAAFGIMQNARWFFIAATTVVLVALVVYAIKTKPDSKLFKVSATLIGAGAVGNLVDRVARGFVVDMIQVNFVDFPVFNVADCCVVVGGILFCWYILKEK
ncbi:MAG: signal peptidase II [Ruminococcaceae bacterium]|nr:signal peptidase II [Oscillospiraceae bacterium]